jgi:hypothetical protein
MGPFRLWRSARARVCTDTIHLVPTIALEHGGAPKSLMHIRAYSNRTAVHDVGLKVRMRRRQSAAA